MGKCVTFHGYHPSVQEDLSLQTWVSVLHGYQPPVQEEISLHTWVSVSMDITHLSTVQEDISLHKWVSVSMDITHLSRRILIILLENNLIRLKEKTTYKGTVIFRNKRSQAEGV